MPGTLKSLTCALACAAVFSPAAVVAQDAASQTLDLELNSVADTSAGSCRLIFVAQNGSGTSLDLAAYQLAVFDSEGVVTRLLRLDFPGLSDGRTKVFQFDLPETQCASIGRFIVNDALACTQSDGAGDSAVCLDGLSASSRTDIEFGL